MFFIMISVQFMIPLSKAQFVVNGQNKLTNLYNLYFYYDVIK